MMDQSPPNASYTFTHKKPIVDGHFKLVEVDWKISNFTKRLFQDKEIISNKTEDYSDSFDADSKFLLKIQPGKAPMEIFYLTPVMLLMRVECYYFHNANSGFKVTQPNIWHPLPITNAKIQYATVNHLPFRFTIDYRHKIVHDAPNSMLTTDLKKLLNNSLFSDVTMKSNDGVEFKAHKAMLAARSDVLKAHFEHNMVESLSNVVEAPFPADVLRQVLNFIYTDNTPKMVTMADQLFQAADYYQINNLKKFSENALLLSLTVDNAIDTLELAYLHSAKELQSKVIEYATAKVNAKHIINTTSWKNLQSIEIIKDLFELAIIKS